ncbi:alpha/beta hydrolase [Goodfellowiella coeruleoviolacea]|uniref:Acetyl esterase n=1 Tax=Goodfellowiella coeruleoviolacea TaxID=334858 RepID=A0AAE3GCF6_9PSEU|nr:alpha/beta hydrolase [Goodfellowiella coeruleoviolacea]MCP2164579.1 acetyl esterase [Goodfellowiella coeruleoviolacea]
MSGPLDTIPVGVQRAVLRGLLGLPAPVRRLLAGPPVRRDGQTLAVPAQLVLRARHLGGARGLAAATPALARAAMLRDNRVVGGPPPPGVHVRALAVAGASASLPARLYWPAGLARPAPLVVFYHGGGWVVGDLDSHDHLCRFLARQAGVAVLAPHYRRAPEHPFPAAVTDALATHAFAVRQAGALGVDPRRIALAGDSAGGNLAVVTALRSRAEPGPRPVFLLLFYPAVDATRRRRSRELFAEGFLLTSRDMDWFMDHYQPDPAARADPALSVLLADDLSGLPPTYLATAGFDPLRDEDEAFAARLAEQGVPVVLRRHPDLIHGFANLFGLGGPFRDAVVEAAGALRAGLVLGASPADASPAGAPADQRAAGQ